MHSRLFHLRHAFSYKVFFARFDVDSIKQFSDSRRMFSADSFNLLSLRTDDFLQYGQGTLREKVEYQLDRHSISMRPERIELITGLRLLGYAFTPVSFFLCYDAVDSLFAVLAFVNNTFSESHIYVLSGNEQVEKEVRGKKNSYRRFTCKKDFHVSPFFDLNWQYEFLIHSGPEGVDLWVNMIREGKTEFYSELWGKTVRFDDLNITKLLVVYPLSAVLNLPRIMIQAAKLRLKGLPVFTRPEPVSEDTVRRRRPSLVQRFCMAGCDRILSGIPNGELTVTLPGGITHVYGTPASGLRADINILDLSFFTDILFHGDIGFGDAYVRGAWQSSDLTALLKLASVNAEIMSSTYANAHILSRPIRLLKKFLRRNSKGGSKRNIGAHYDLGNSFYELMLDETMSYSSAIFKSEKDSLREAQWRKIDKLLDGLNLSTSSHLLEIGSGWGELAKRAAERFGCRVTSVTISREQFDYARKKISEAGLDRLVSIEFKDYRDLSGKYDAIVSVEMIEAVGRQFLRGFLVKCSHLLRNGGRFALQAITIADKKYEDYCRTEDWIQRRVFPGGHLPSLGHLKQIFEDDTALSIRDIHSNGDNYRMTLIKWRERFFQNIDAVKKLGFNDCFIRTWEYYLCYCEVGFDTRLIDSVQLLLEKR
jgi:cyclopropane-fatty-acyl-phospholipid synthase